MLKQFTEKGRGSLPDHEISHGDGHRPADTCHAVHQDARLLRLGLGDEIQGAIDVLGDIVPALVYYIQPQALNVLSVNPLRLHLPRCRVEYVRYALLVQLLNITCVFAVADVQSKTALVGIDFRRRLGAWKVDTP